MTLRRFKVTLRFDPARQNVAVIVRGTCLPAARLQFVKDNLAMLSEGGVGIESVEALDPPPRQSDDPKD